METLGMRLEKILIALNISQLSFSKKVGINQSFLSAIINDRKEMSRGMLQKILKHYPQINSNWLFTGHGGVFMPDESTDMVVNDPPASYIAKGEYKIHSIGDELYLKGILVANLKTAAKRWKLYNQELFSILDPSVVRQAVSKYFLGHTLPNLPALVRFEYVTGIPLSVLVTREIAADELPGAPIEPGDVLPGLLSDLKRVEVQIKAFLDTKK